MGRHWAQSKPSEYQQNQREGGELESHLQKKTSSNVNKCNYQGVYFEKNKGAPSIIKPKIPRFTLDTEKKRGKAKNKKQNKQKKLWVSKYKVAHKTCNYWKHSKTALHFKACVKTNSLRMQISQLTRHCHHTIGAIFDSSSSSCLS